MSDETLSAAADGARGGGEFAGVFVGVDLLCRRGGSARECGDGDVAAGESIAVDGEDECLVIEIEKVGAADADACLFGVEGSA